jgi:hypothetical protein
MKLNMQTVRQMVSNEPYVKSAAPIVRGEETLYQRLHRQTYLCLRLVMAVIAISLPLVFLVSAYWVGMQNSISAFYHTDMRNVFVGVLFAIGICLYVYKGYNNLENYGLTTAGVFLLGVALSPTSSPNVSLAWYFPVIHNICAVTFFGLIAIVCIFARENGITKTEEFRSAYFFTAFLMGLVLVAAFALLLIDKIWGIGFSTSTFWVEAAAVWVFAGYWCIKSRELGRLG